jgi:uncharacterized membrane protein YqgA involved in biofilm formation
MTGTFINVAAILLGGVIGIFFGRRLPEKLKETVVAGMGLFVAALGIQMFLEVQSAEQALVVLGALLSGAILGEWWRIEERIQNLGAWLEQKFARGGDGDQNGDGDGGLSGRFVRGFLSASLIYCTGPMAILGAISDGLKGDYQTLAIKSILDGFITITFSSTLGVGVLFSVIPVLVYQGGISLLAGQLSGLLSAAMIDAMTATGGVLLLGLSLSSLLQIKPMRIGNFLPALAIAPLIVYVLGLFK